MYECVFVSVWCTCSSLFHKLDWMERLNVILVLVCCVFVHGIWCIRHIRGCYEYSLNERKEETKKNFLSVSSMCIWLVCSVGKQCSSLVVRVQLHCSHIDLVFATTTITEKKKVHTQRVSGRIVESKSVKKQKTKINIGKNQTKQIKSVCFHRQIWEFHSKIVIVNYFQTFCFRTKKKEAKRKKI